MTLGWATLAGIPWTTPYAAVVDANAEQLAGALANGAKHNTRIAAALDRAMNGGGGVYALQLAAVGANMAVQTVELMRDPALRAAGDRVDPYQVPGVPQGERREPARRAASGGD